MAVEGVVEALHHVDDALGRGVRWMLWAHRGQPPRGLDALSDDLGQTSAGADGVEEACVADLGGNPLREGSHRHSSVVRPSRWKLVSFDAVSNCRIK